MDLIFACFVVIFLWCLAGSACITAWKDLFDEISSRRVRVSARILVMIFWPAWIVLWVVGVLVAMFLMLILELFE